MIKSISIIGVGLLAIFIISFFGLMSFSEAKRDEKPASNFEIIRVGKCQYVFWNNGYGSDMEHYESCNSLYHSK